MKRTTLLLALLYPLVASVVSAETYEVNDGDHLFDIIESLSPGDVVTVYGGTYNTPGYVMCEWHGTSDEPIVVTAAEGTSPWFLVDERTEKLCMEG